MMNKVTTISNSPICMGAGLVTLDVIYNKNGRTKPNFLAGGSCVNVLTILSYLGWRSYPIARLGKDVEGSRILEDMKQWKVNTKFVLRDAEIDSPRIIQRFSKKKSNKHSFHLKCSHGKWLPRRRPILLKTLEILQNKFPKSNVFYFDRVSTSILAMAKIQKAKGALIVFEPPKLGDDELFYQCLEIADIVKHCYHHSISKNYGIKIPLEIQTMGKDGLIYKSTILDHRNWKHLDSYRAVNLVDASGSGDWLTAGIIYILGQNGNRGRISERKLKLALNFGQCLATINCNFIGARGTMYNLSKQKLLSLV